MPKVLTSICKQTDVLSWVFAGRKVYVWNKRGFHDVCSNDV